MTTQHTKGRLHVNKDVGIYSDKGRIVAIAHSPIHQSGCDDARRLVAAWNACDGIPTSDLEKSALPEIITNLLVAKIQRDELLTALKEIVQMWDHHCNAHGDGTPSPLHTKARATIAKAQGEA